MAGQPEGLTVTFQGYLCSPLYEYSRSVGLEPDFGFVHIHRDEFLEFKVRESLAGVDATATTQDRGRGDGFASAGDLVISEIADGKEFAVTLKQVLVSERAVESVVAVNDATEIVRVEITDIRYLWRTRGLLTAWINVPRAPSADPASASGGAGGTVSPSSAATAPSTSSGGGAPPFVEGSLKGGVPWTLRQVLEQVVLPQLAGTPKLRRLPQDLEQATPIGHVWDGVLPKRALLDLLDEFQLVLALNPDSSISLWHEGEGNLMVDNGAQGFDLPDDDERISSKRQLVSYNYVPAVVVVVGPPTIQTARVGPLEAVGEKNGRIVPLEDALAAIGLSLAAARRFAFLDHAQRSVFLGVTPSGMAEFERWAFKWFRLPGGTDQNADKLPMLDRGVPDEVGQSTPPRVWSETTKTQNVAAALIAQAERNAGGSGKALDLGLSAIQRLPVSQLRAVVNVPFTEQNSGYKLDRERGIVLFDAIQGNVAVEGLSLAVAELAPRPVQVQIEFGYASKPGRYGQPSLADRYTSVWVRGPDPSRGGQADRSAPASQVDVKQVTAVPSGIVPLAVSRPDLQLVKGQDGSSNVAQLDQVAKSVAKAILGRPQAQVGAIVQLHRPAPVLNTGKVRSVSWKTETDATGSGPVPRVIAHVGTYDPLAPPGVPRTHARLHSENASSLRDYVLLQRGLRQP